MSSSRFSLSLLRAVLFLLCILTFKLSFARDFEVGIGRPGGINGPVNTYEPGRNFQNHTPYNRPGYGWGNSAVIITNPVPLYNSNCQTVQQCTAYGGCIQTNECE